MKEAVEKHDKSKFLYTLEVDPAYGKYHYDGHAACKVSMSPKESLAVNNICPVCKKPMTIGVEHRVEQLADRPVDYVPKDAIPFKSIMPLHDIIAAIFNVDVPSKKVATEANKLILSFGSELNVLMEAPEKALKELSSERIAKALIDNRNGMIKVKPGYDGEYGVPLIEGAETPVKPQKVSQKSLSDY
jgi:PHP family Zn ribbon phosphoesterase